MELALVAVLTIPSYFASAVGGSRKLATVFKMEEEDTETGRALSEAKGDIVLKDSSFSYGDHEALNDISVVIPYGKITAIIGPNGSGKSTLAKLIDRLYPANNGDILLGDENATDVSLKSWRQQFGIVSQSPSLFSGSIRDNICYGLEREVSQEELDRVVQLSGLEDIIAAHPEGLDYEIGLKGNRLSGGEQQRVAIARALLKNPQYLILDEATANLDVRTEAEVSDGLRELMKDRTVIIIAHDYQVVRDADQFIIMKEGTIETVGTLQEVSGNDYFRQFIKADIA